MIIVKTPMRVSLFGGGTDYPSHFNEHGGAVLGMAIDKYVWTSLRQLPPFFEHKHRIVYSKVETVNKVKDLDHPAVRAVLDTYHDHGAEGLEMHHDADLPARSGMGSSSSFTVGLLNALAAFQGEMWTKKDLADAAIDIEQNIIGENVGSQDQVWAAYGGLNRIDFLPGDGFSVKPLIMSASRREELTKSIVLYFTGFSRDASAVSAAQMSNVRVNTGLLNTMKGMVDEAEKILGSDQPLSELGKLISDAWHCKKHLSSSVTTPDIDDMHDAGLKAGAWGGKLLGAGSGGFMMFLVPNERWLELNKAMNGRICITTQVDYDGSKVVLYQPDGL